MGFMHRFVDFETTAGGGDELDVASQFGFDEEPSLEAGAAEPAAPGEDAAVPAAPAWTPTRDELQELIGGTVAEQFSYLMAQAQAQQPEYEEPQPQLEELDFYDPQTLAGFIQQSTEQAIQSALAPLMPVLQRSQAEQAEQQVESWLTDSKQQLGGFADESSDTMSAYVAHGMLPGTVDPYRAPNGNPERAIREAAKFVKQYEETLMKKGEERFLARQQGLREAQGRPVAPVSPSGVPATELLVHEKGEDELSIARRIVARQAG